jgi:hypothetical protein
MLNFPASCAARFSTALEDLAGRDLTFYKAHLLNFPASCSARFSTSLEDLAGRTSLLFKPSPHAFAKGRGGPGDVERLLDASFVDETFWYTLRGTFTAGKCVHIKYEDDRRNVIP